MYILPLFILFAWFVTYQVKRTTAIGSQKQEEYREYELNANFVRKKDISGLPYIKVPLEELPFQDTTNPDLTELQDKVKEIAQTDILNLTGISNTDLKYQYGVANLDKLSICDNNFIKLSRALYNWGMWLYKNQNINEARKVLEYAVSCKVDISGIYTTLASIYCDNNEADKIDYLKEQVATLNTLMKDSILKSLDAFQSH